MKLTKDQRYTMYCILLQEIKKEPDGICLIWYNIFHEVTWHERKHLRKYLPELWENRFKTPIRDGESWFESHKQRIEALKQCIAETENF